MNQTFPLKCFLLFLQGGYLSNICYKTIMKSVRNWKAKYFTITEKWEHVCVFLKTLMEIVPQMKIIMEIVPQMKEKLFFLGQS